MPQNSECESNNLIFYEKYLSGSWQSTAMDLLWFLLFLGVLLWLFWVVY